MSSKTILTAAHCLERTIKIFWWYKVKLFVPAEVKVLAAAHDWPKEDYEELAVLSIHRHPKWNWRTLAGDFAILKLRDDIKLHLGAQPICLQSLPAELYEGSKGIATGWGLTAPPVPPQLFNLDTVIPDKLQEANLTTMSNSMCKHYMQYIRKDKLINDDMICAKGDDQYTCFGDSGGIIH